MRIRSLLSAFVFTLLGAPVAFAQTPVQTAAGNNSYNDSVSRRCNTMTGAEKDQCLRDENAKTEGKSPERAAAASTTGAGNSNDSYSRNQSKRCNTMTGAEKDQCLRDEDGKTDSNAGSGIRSSR
ncbi:MAG TPA: hypothetical protein VK572_09495 [Burkholderiales bacterium]|nr:hypothetical protein [Burkholderiales bacterium]